jgi:hypothetical protein
VEFRFPWSPYRYRIACVIEPQLTRPLYARDAWFEIVPHLDAIIETLGLPAFIRTWQTRPEDTARQLPFGRLKWSRANNERWTTQYLEGPQPTHFWCTEVWARDWSYHDQHGGYPDLFCRVEHLLVPAESQAFVLAIRKAVLANVAEAADAALDLASAHYRDPQRLVFDRIWAEREVFFRAIRTNELHRVSPLQVMEWGEAHPERAVTGFRAP